MVRIRVIVEKTSRATRLPKVAHPRPQTEEELQNRRYARYVDTWRLCHRLTDDLFKKMVKDDTMAEGMVTISTTEEPDECLECHQTEGACTCNRQAQLDALRKEKSLPIVPIQEAVCPPQLLTAMESAFQAATSEQRRHFLSKKRPCHPAPLPK